MTRHAARLLVPGAMLLVTAVAVHAVAGAGDRGPLSIARQGYLFAGGKYTTVNGRQVMSGQMYAEFQIPSKQTHAWPIVMVHGGGQTGTNFTGTPDGREGWAQYFLRQGYAVYVVDQVGRGRSGYLAAAYGPDRNVERDNSASRYVAEEKFNLWPQAHLHAQWPGAAQPGDPVFDQFYASQFPSLKDFAKQQELN